MLAQIDRAFGFRVTRSIDDFESVLGSVPRSSAKKNSLSNC